MKDVLKVIISIYQVDKFDWMNYRVTKSNPLTYHHLVKKEYGGKETISNGAPLTVLAHKYLHLIEFYDKSLYNRINDLLKEINAQKSPPTPNQNQRMELLLLEFELSYAKDLKKKWHKKHTKWNPTSERKQQQAASCKPPRKGKKIMRKTLRRY